MKKEFVEFLIKRLGSKIDDARNVDVSDLDPVLNDIEVYANTILEIAKEALLL
jgi:hypothetical protein